MVTHEPSPREFMAAETEAFVAGALGALPLAPPSTVLEVGAGDGRLAARLARRGFRVVALESDARRAGAARGRGVTVIEADFLGPADSPGPTPASAGALLFTRVLHHLDPLEAALQRAESLLAPSGLVVGEEFAYERADRAAIAWLGATRERAARLGLLPPEPDPARETLESWTHHHAVAHRLHRGDALLPAVAARFDRLVVSAAPYLYRYLCTRLVDSAEGAAFAAAIFAEEERAIADGLLPAIGLRFVARRR